jgi:hypothetical protein
MRRLKPQPIRNELDLSDRMQVRLIRKRLRLSGSELTDIVGRIGNSLAAISKEVAVQRANVLPDATDKPPPAVIVAIAAEDQATAHLTTSEPAP